MKVSLQFIADKAGVSKSLVSKVLNGRAVRVAEDTKKRILDVAKTYNYVPNRLAMNLRTKTTHTIALIVPNISFEFFSKLCYAVESRAAELGYNVIICNTLENIDKEKQHLELCRMGIVDGIIICPTGEKENIAEFQYLMNQEFPIVFVDRYIKQLDVPAVITDNTLASYELTTQFIESGYKDILFINRRHGTSDQEERYNGYEKAMKAHNLSTKRSYLYKGNVLNKEMLEQLAVELPEAIVMSTSWDIIKLLQVFYPKGIEIQKDVQIAAFDSFYIPYGDKEDFWRAQSIKEPLRIVEQKPYEMGTKAMDLLVASIHREDIKDKKVMIGHI